MEMCLCSHQIYPVLLVPALVLRIGKHKWSRLVFKPCFPPTCETVCLIALLIMWCSVYSLTSLKRRTKRTNLSTTSTRITGMRPWPDQRWLSGSEGQQSEEMDEKGTNGIHPTHTASVSQSRGRIGSKHGLVGKNAYERRRHRVIIIIGLLFQVN